MLLVTQPGTRTQPVGTVIYTDDSERIENRSVEHLNWFGRQIMEEMLASGAIAVLFGSRRDSTYSILVSKGRGRAMPKGAFDIPMFTIASSLSDGFTECRHFVLHGLCSLVGQLRAYTCL